MAHEALSRRLFDAEAERLTDEFAERLGIQVNSKTWPVIDVTVLHSSVRFRLQCDNWDDLAPAVEVLNPDGAPYNGAQGVQQLNRSAHPSTGRMFICMRGAREYHNHPSHVNDRWDQYRGQDGMNLIGILMQLIRAWQVAA